MKEIAVVDIETTGFLKQGGLILEIGIAKLNLETGETTSLYNQLVKEEGLSQQHKNSWIFSNSDLKFNDVMNAKPLDISTLQNIFNEFSATAYNKRFDFDFLINRGLKIKELPCPMIISTDICKLPSPTGYKWPKLEEAWLILMNDKDYIEKHRGLDDAMHEAKLIFKLYKMGVFKI